MSALTLALPTQEEDRADLRAFLSGQKAVHARKRELAAAAASALPLLLEACAAKSGQASKLRALLFSLWNGRPADLSDVLALDMPLREAFVAVVAGFGFDGDASASPFFYKAIEKAFKDLGLFEWFTHVGDEEVHWP